MDKFLEKQQSALDLILEENPEDSLELILLPDQVISIYNSPGRTSMLAQLFRVSTKTIANIKSGTGEYKQIVHWYKQKYANYLRRQRHGKVVQY